MKFSWVCWVVVLGLSACERKAEPVRAAPPEAHADEAGHPELPRQLRVSAEVVKAAGITTTKARRSALSRTLSLPGEVVPEPDRTARLSAATAGRLEQVSFNEGSVVKKGEVLAVLRVPDVGRLRGALAAAAARAKAARTNTSRLQVLQASGLGAEQAVVDAEAEARVAEAEAQSLTEQLSAIGVNAASGGGYLVPLRAPLSGVVVARDAVVGQPIGAEHVLATVVDLEEVWFLGRVFEKDLGQLVVGAKSEVVLNAFPKTPFEGVVDYVGQQTDPVARTVTARIRLANPAGTLRLGLFGTARVAVANEDGAVAHLVVPRSAVTEVGAQRVVFVQAADGDFVVHQVTVGDGALGEVQVLSGLDEGEQVVSSGVFTLKSLLLKSTLSEDEH